MNIIHNHSMGLVVQTCYKCDTVFAMSENVYKRADERGHEFFCPNGHGQIFSKSKVAKLEERIVKKDQIIKNNQKAADYYRHCYMAAERKVAAYKGVATKLRNKIADV